MPSTTYALLVGIDAYPAPVNPLRGCVNDIRRVESLLRARLAPPDGRPHPFQPRVLTDAQATRQGIIDGFRQHLRQARADDVALFYYSGHGSQAPSPPEFWHLEPDRLDETLVCWDSRLPEPNHWDLADKELAQLVAEVAESGAHVVVILDCCHSGSGTRMAEEAEVRSRRLPTDDRMRPAATFLVSAEQAAALTVTERSTQAGSGWFTLARGRHVLLAACAPEEEAKELSLGGEQRGAFSFYLLETLQRGRATLSYRDLFKRVNARVRASVSLQSPQLEAHDNRDLGQPFLGGAIPEGPAYYTASYQRESGWAIDGGAVHGIPAPGGDTESTRAETTILAIFPFDSPPADLQNLGTAIGEARVTRRDPTQSMITLMLHNGQSPEPHMTYKALVTALPLTPMVVALEGDAAGLALVRAALAHAGPARTAADETDNNADDHGDDAPTGAPSLLVQEGDLEAAELIVTARDDSYHIRRKGDGYPLVVATRDFTPIRAQLVVQRLEHIARWRKIVELANPDSRLDEAGIRLEIELPDGAGGWQPAAEGRAVRQEYTYQNGAWQQPTFRIKLSNHATRRLYCMAFDLTETWGVYTLLPGGGVWLGPGEETWANAGEPFYGSVPDELWNAG
ncbi:MAG: caspase family protein, partial [Litorilinea sp.]